MTPQEFETRVLRLWTATSVPLTRANVQALTKAPRENIQRWMDAMVSDGIAELDSDDAGEMFWVIRGSARSRTDRARSPKPRRSSVSRKKSTRSRAAPSSYATRAAGAPFRSRRNR